MLARPVTSASTETRSAEQGVADQDVVDQLRLALEDPGEPVLGGDPRGEVPQPPASPLSGWLNPPVPNCDPGGPYSSWVVAACGVSFRSPSTINGRS